MSTPTHAYPAYPVPEDEVARLDALHRYQILDSGPEQAYEDIVQLAAQICDVPMAAISLIDDDRQWFKATVGVDEPQTSREQAFCSHTICQDGDPLVVEDASQDARFQANPLVQDDPSIRFYAGAPLRTPDDQHLGALCVISDEAREIPDEQLQSLQVLSRQVVRLFELRRTALELREAGDAVLAQNEELDRFTRAVAHDLKEPMVTLHGHLEMVRMELEDQVGAEELEHLVQTQRTSKRMTDHVNGLLRYARLDEGTMPRDPVPLGKLVDEVLASLSATVQRKDAKIHIEPLPTIEGDRDQLACLLQNLLSNALKFCQAPTVHVKGEVHPHGAILKVQDDGPGIPAEDQARIFELFKRGRDPQAEGTGLGLAMCRKIAQRHGGTISVSSEPGAGATFQVQWPADRVS